MKPGKRHHRAVELWPILVQLAQDRETRTYSELASTMGLRGPRPMWMFLGPIMHYCDAKGLPPLTAVVVQMNTGRPGTGLLTSTDPARDKRRVFAYDWSAVTPPTTQELATAPR